MFKFLLALATATSAVQITTDRETPPLKIKYVVVRYGVRDWRFLPQEIVDAWNHHPHDKFCVSNVLKKGWSDKATGLAIKVERAVLNSVEIYYQPAFKDFGTSKVYLKLWDGGPKRAVTADGKIAPMFIKDLPSSTCE